MTDEIEKSALQKALDISNSAAITKRAALDAENTAGMLNYVTALMDKMIYPFTISPDETMPRRQHSPLRAVKLNRQNTNY
jgi:hypothetical protein